MVNHKFDNIIELLWDLIYDVIYPYVDVLFNEKYSYKIKNFKWINNSVSISIGRSYIYNVGGGSLGIYWFDFLDVDSDGWSILSSFFLNVSAYIKDSGDLGTKIFSSSDLRLLPNVINLLSNLEVSHVSVNNYLLWFLFFKQLLLKKEFCPSTVAYLTSPMSIKYKFVSVLRY